MTVWFLEQDRSFASLDWKETALSRFRQAMPQPCPQLDWQVLDWQVLDWQAWSAGATRVLPAGAELGSLREPRVPTAMTARELCVEWLVALVQPGVSPMALLG